MKLIHARKKHVTRVAVWLVVFAMLATFFPISGNNAKAESLEYLICRPCEQSSVTVETGTSVDVNLGVPTDYNTTDKIKNAGFSRLEIQFEVLDYTADSSGTAGAQAYFGYGDEWKNSGWVNLSDGILKTSIDLGSYISTENKDVWAFGIQFANVTGTVTYKISSAKLVGIKTTKPIEANYAKLLQYSLYFYDANMCGSNVSEDSLVATGKKYGEYAGYRSDCHTCDEKANYKGTSVDVSGGYHDAGDHAKFNLPQAYSASMLGIAYSEFPDAFLQTGQLQHYKTIMNHFCDYFVNCTILDATGDNVETYCYQVGNGGTDHAYWGAPESQPERSNEAYFTSNSTPCTDIVGETAAALAINAYNFPSDANAEKYLLTAEKLFDYAQTNVKGTSSNSEASAYYSGSSYEDDMALAAIWLYRATGEQKYKSIYNQYATSIQSGYLNCWDNVSVAALSYGSDWSNSKSSLDNYCNRLVCDGYTFVDAWGSARYNTSLQFEALCYDKNTSTSTYKDWAMGQMNYLLGENSTGRCYVVGYSDMSSKNPHHRAASGCTDYNEFNAGKTENRKVLLGALCGGISNTTSHSGDSKSNAEYQTDTNYFYHDDVRCYVCNEVALDYNASLVAAAAGLYANCSDGSKQMLDSNYSIDLNATCNANKGGDVDEPSTTTNPVVSTPAPSSVPTISPTAEPSAKPTGGPTAKPTSIPTIIPSVKPSVKPTSKPTIIPSSKPTNQPTILPTEKPAGETTSVPSILTGTIGNDIQSEPQSNLKTNNSVSQKKLIMAVGASKKVKSEIAGAIWSSSNGKVASINNKGVIKAKKKGTVTIIAKNNSREQRFILKVTSPKLSRRKCTCSKGKKIGVSITGLDKKSVVKMKMPKKKVKVKRMRKTKTKWVYSITGKKKGSYAIVFVADYKKIKMKVKVR